jgi:protochlorophyllide reductase
VLFTRELQKKLDASSSTRGIVANCFTPGLIVSTGFFRNQNPLFTKLFDFAATSLFKVAESPYWGGGALVYTTNVTTKGQYYAAPSGSVKIGDAAFGNQFTVATVSSEAQDDQKARDLWTMSEQVWGIKS